MNYRQVRSSCHLFINKVLLGHSHAHSLYILSDGLYITMTEFSSCTRNECKTKPLTIWKFKEKVCQRMPQSSDCHWSIISTLCTGLWLPPSIFPAYSQWPNHQNACPPSGIPLHYSFPYFHLFHALHVLTTLFIQAKFHSQLLESYSSTFPHFFACLYPSGNWLARQFTICS